METIKIDVNVLPKTTKDPILRYCRKLVNNGANPDSKLEIWRNGTLAMTIHNIGEASLLATGIDAPSRPTYGFRKIYRNIKDMKKNKLIEGESDE